VDCIEDVAEKLSIAPSHHPSPTSGGGSKRDNKLLTTAIIGGGYAGMAAAVTLAASNIPVTVFESAKQLGGRARGVMQHGTQLDNGQHILLGCYKNTLRLIEQVGGNLEQDFQRLPLQLTLHKRFELKAPRLPAPLHLLVGFLRAKGLSYTARLHAARFMLAMRLRKFKLAQDVSALELLRSYRQDEALIRLLWEPICISALNTPIHKASAQILLNVLRDSLNGSRADSDMLLPRIDFSALFPERAAQYIATRGGKVMLSCGVEAITRQGDGFELITAEGAQRFDRVICAASPNSAARLLKSLITVNNISEQIEAIPCQPIYTVYLQYPAAVTLPHPMLGLDRCISQWLFDRGHIADQHGLIAIVISAEGIHQDLPQEQLAQKVIAELQEQLGIAEAPLWHRVIAEKRATFSCEVNLARPGALTPVANLLLAGDYTEGDYPATLEGAVMSGLRSAYQIINDHSSVKPYLLSDNLYHY
jgi:squalene-associated FAD-dependent desaturase